MSSPLDPSHSLSTAMNIDMIPLPPKPESAAVGLPTPSSLPRHPGPLFDETGMGREEGEEEGSASGSEGGVEEELFAMEVEGELELETESGR